MLFEEWAELSGQRNAIDGRMVEIVAEIERDVLVRHYRRAVGAGVGGLEDRGVRRPRAHDRYVAGRLEEFPRARSGMREGRLSLDQVGVIAARGGRGF